MQIRPLRSDLVKYLQIHHLIKKYQKQADLFENNSLHPSLHTEILEPKHLNLYSFRIDRKYRAIFIVVTGQAEIVDINLHYH